MPEDFRKLRASLRTRGLFKSSKLFYTWKTLSTFSIMFLALSIIVLSSSWTSCVWAAFALALFWQQMGWLAHDFLHHQVFTSRRCNNAVGLLMGNVCQVNPDHPFSPLGEGASSKLTCCERYKVFPRATGVQYSPQIGAGVCLVANFLRNPM